jgi:uncharacterized membrane protein
MTSHVRRIGLGTVLIALALNLLLGLLLKAQPSWGDGHLSASCAAGEWHGQQYSKLCYSDILPLYGTEHLQGGRLPYLDRCEGGGTCDEYPVLTMYAMWVAARPVSTYAGFFFSNAFLLVIAAAATAVFLYVMAGARALYFALAPTLLVYGLMNWDLLAVALATGATLAFLTRRDVGAGVLLGLGAAAKLYPAILVIPFVAQRFRERDPDGGIHLTWAAVGAWLAVNVPFAVFGFHGWSQFFTFNTGRPPDFDSLWYIGCDLVKGDDPADAICGGFYDKHQAFVNVGSLAAFLIGAAVVWGLKARRNPDFPRWTLGLPLIVLFLLTNKVYSPQYGLWLLPWFALGLPDLGRLRSVWLFAAFELTDVGVFVTRFLWFGTLDPYHFGGPGQWMFEAAVLARTAVLVVCLLAWVRGEQPSIPAVRESVGARRP